MNSQQQAFEEYAMTNPEVKANPDLLKVVDKKYVNGVIEMHWQTYQQGRKDEAQSLHPFNWTKQMSEAWHKAIPDLHKAFDDLISAEVDHGQD